MSISKYITSIVVSENDLDELMHVNNVRYFDYLQETAVAHWRGSVPQEIADSIRWVVKKHEIEYHKPAHLGDELTIETWISEFSGVISQRFYRILREDILLVSACTHWVSIDPITMKPKRLSSDIGVKYFGL